MKIRREIEREIERDLEEEIKGGIYEQALQLHRLYQHRRKAADINPPEERRKKELLEVNISIKLQRGTKLQIKETKKEAPPPAAESFRPRTSRSDATAARTVLPEVKRLDWVKSLRSGAAPVVVGKNVGCHRSRIPAPGRQWSMSSWHAVFFFYCFGFICWWGLSCVLISRHVVLKYKGRFLFFYLFCIFTQLWVWWGFEYDM